MLESKIQARILKRLKKLNDCYVYKNIVTSKKGVPDICMVYLGKPIFLEVKRPGGKPTELQEYNIKKIREAGGVAEVVHSWEEVEKLIWRIEEQF